MLERIKWLTIMITIAGIVMGAQAAFEHLMRPAALAAPSTSTSTQVPSATISPTTTTAPQRKVATSAEVQILEIYSTPPEGGPSGEFIRIGSSLAEPVDLTGWTIRDDEKNLYTFPAYSLTPGGAVQVWTGVGVDRADDLYWNLSAELWNDGGDCGYLRDPQGNLQSYICY